MEERLKDKGRRGKDAETGRKLLFRLFFQEGKEYNCHICYSYMSNGTQCIVSPG